ncbi:MULTISPECIES: isocitrate/isopropylmalate family dehydrogenase [Pseudomonas]|uniref:isocitrate/isopropylmalate dehydrogenase family protein n=1 Tax=Pseudomonas TaxID=286 RepID=UPI000CD58553|nr:MULTISPECIES: isocitrate/isopropylmalate family dehydrogenase [Pseudomonas]RBH59087.1 isocitrate/isopropylmalate dehydrogenase family protein [Pseudomonas sp. MWU13-2860]
MNTLPPTTSPRRPARHRVCVLPGDGVGVEVVNALLPIFDALQLPIELDFGQIGWECWRQNGDPVPAETWAKIAAADATLLGAITSKGLHEAEAELPAALRDTGRTYVSPVIQLRQRLSLYANVRPVTDVLGDNRFRFTVIRENTEGLYAGLDFASIPAEFEPLLKAKELAGAPWTRASADDATMTVRLQTRAGLTRLFKFAFEYARRHGYQRVTLADKPNVLRYSGAFAREILENVAAQYPDIAWNIDNVDAVALWMIRRPERFGVIVAENMFGDILSDLGAGVMGGLGFAPSANIGDAGAYFEPVHGSAPAHVGQEKANPSAMFLSLALLLEHLGYGAEAWAIEQAVTQVVRHDCQTYDSGGQASTGQCAAAIIQRSVLNLHSLTASLDKGPALTRSHA